MKQAQNARKQRGRSAQRKSGKTNGGGGNRSENKVRGNPKQLLEKYKTQARDALQAGDRITAEYYLQFADHYQRVLNEMQAGRDQAAEEGGRRSRGRRNNNQAADTDSADSAATDKINDEAAQPGNGQAGEASVAQDPAEAEQPAEVHPELDLGEVEKPAKPKRAPRKRRAPKSAPAEAKEAPEAAPKGDEAA